MLSAGTIGNTLEFYGFIVYGSIAALVFNTVFFPSFSPVAGTLLALSTFAAGFLARPVGAAIFGTLGDRIGRRQTLMLTLVIMGSSTFLVGQCKELHTERSCRRSLHRGPEWPGVHKASSPLTRS
ncbi:MFS transporter [Arthrobacter globiformis]|uniref:MFS transporter n=1 Tax=Arthrobacter globiformis TaxID=1665 RepID=UPI00278849E6|nr:MFS family permease [Arthrobacter globiformis]